MEPIRLSGKERHDFEREAISRLAKSRQLVMRVILDFCAGKAECWPNNATLARSSGLAPRSVIYILRSLEAAGAIRCVADLRIPSQRRIVVLGHPGSSVAIRTVRDAKTSKPPVQALTGEGCKEPIRRGMQKTTPEVLKRKKEETPARSASESPPGVRECNHETTSPSEPSSDDPWADSFRRFFGHVPKD